MKVIQKHNLDIEGAKKKLETEFLPGLQRKFQSILSDLSYNWNDNRAQFSFRLLEFNIKGIITVTESEIVFEAGLPLAALIVEGQIRQTIEKGLKKNFG